MPPRRTVALIVAILLAGYGTVALADSPYDDIRHHTETLLESLGTPGAAVVVVSRDSDPGVLAGFGARDLDTGEPVTPETRFLLASATKAFTAAALGVLVDEGMLNWDTPVADALPGFRLADDHATLHVTLRDLLAHHSGLATNPFVFYRSSASRESIVESLRHLAMGAELRQRFQYSNLGYLVAGEVGARAIDDRWETLVRSRLLEPLGMEATGFSGDAATDRDTTAYRSSTDGPRAIAWPDVRAIAAAGGLITSARDLVPWLRLQLSDGSLDGRRVLTADTLAELQAPQSILYGRALPDLPDNPFVLYGLGWNIGVYRGHRLLWHAGATDGFGSMVAVLPDDGYAMAVLSNESFSELPSTVVFYAVERLLGLEPIDRPATPMRRRKATETEPVPVARPLDVYTGTFTHPAYGEITIVTTETGLVFKFRGLESSLVHRGDDRFDLTGERALGGLWVRFESDGTIERLRIPFAPALEPIVFQRTSDER